MSSCLHKYTDFSLCMHVAMLCYALPVSRIPSTTMHAGNCPMPPQELCVRSFTPTIAFCMRRTANVTPARRTYLLHCTARQAFILSFVVRRRRRLETKHLARGSSDRGIGIAKPSRLLSSRHVVR